MQIFYFLMACGIQLVVASAAQPYDPLEYVRIPQAYQPLFSTLRDIMTPDEQGQPRHTFRDVKTLMDPLKPVYNELTTVPKLYALIKGYEKKIREYKENSIKIKRDEDSTAKAITFLAGRTIENIFMFCEFYYGYESSLKPTDFIHCTSDIAVILNYPQDVIDEYISLDLQKIFFPFYTMGLLKAVFMMCDLIIDPKKEGFVDGCYEPLLNRFVPKEMPIVDLEDQLDQPFLTVFDQALQNDQINFALRLKGCSRQRLTESLLNMLDNHVQFIKPRERTCH